MPRLQTIYDWGSFIQFLRSEHFLGWTQEKLAQQLGVSLSSVSKWESAGIEPQPKTRAKLRALANEIGFQREMWPKKEHVAPRSMSSTRAGRNQTRKM